MLIDPEALKSVDSLRTKYSIWIACPSRGDLQKIDPKIRKWAETLFKSELGSLRNQVVHKNAYRPTKDEVDKYLLETRDTLIPPGHALGVQGDDVNWYAHKLERERKDAQ